MAPSETPVVLLVDDDPAILGSLRFLLEAEGFEVRAFASGAELLALEHLPRSGCLVTNLEMPGMTGLDLHERLRARQASLPTILITGRYHAALRARAAAAGVALTVEKPLLDDTLLDGIRRALRSG
jgi:FixJ family two-component response regulator